MVYSVAVNINKWDEALLRGQTSLAEADHYSDITLINLSWSTRFISAWQYALLI